MQTYPTTPPEQETLASKALVCLRPDWHGTWQQVANWTAGITQDDPRFSSVMVALEGCDRAWLRQDWAAFCRAVKGVQAAIESRA